MATVEDIAKELLGSTDSDVGFLNAVKWINNRYQQLVSRVRFRHLRKIGEIQLPARYDTGTVSVTRDSTSVTGSSTSWATTPGTGSHQYWFFRPSSAWYKISSVASNTSLTLSTAFSEDTVSSGSYSIIKRYHALDASARWLGDFVFTRLRINLGAPVPLEQLDSESPGRNLVGSYPLRVAQVGVDTSNNLMVEFYPYPEDSEIIHYVYWSIPSTLSITTTIPAQIDAYILKEGALIDLNRYLAGKAANAGKIEAAAFYRNESRAQETRWENYIREAVQTDRGSDDATFILEHFGSRSVRSRDIINARDIVLDRWEWPG